MVFAVSRREIPFPEAAAALEYAENGHSYAETERLTGVDSVTVKDILKRKGHWAQDVETPVFLEWRTRIKREIQGRANELATKLLAHAEKCITEKPDETSPYQAIGMYGILRTHDRLDAGEATEHIAVLHHYEIQDQEDLLGRLAAALETSKNPTSEPKKVNDDGEL